MVPTATKTQSPASGTKVSLRPVADTFVDQKTPSTVYGSKEYIIIDKDPVNVGYLRFDLSGVDVSKVAKAELLVYVGEGSDKGFQVRLVSDNNWSEGSVNFTNPPGVGKGLGSSGQPVSGTWMRVNLFPEGATPNLSNGSVGLVSLALIPQSNDAFYIGSKEAGVLAPQLVLTYK